MLPSFVIRVLRRVKWHYVVAVTLAFVLFLEIMWLGPVRAANEAAREKVIAMVAKATARPPVRFMDPIADCVDKCPHNPDSSYSDSPGAVKYLTKYDCGL